MTFKQAIHHEVTGEKGTPPLDRTNTPHGFGCHALRNLIGGKQEFHSPSGTSHNGGREGVGEQVRPRALPQQVNEGLRSNCVAT